MAWYVKPHPWRIHCRYKTRIGAPQIVHKIKGYILLPTDQLHIDMLT